MRNNRLIIVGAGGHGKVVADIAYLSGYKDIIFLDSDETMIGEYIGFRTHKVAGIPIDIDKFDGDVFVAIGDSATREKILDFYSNENKRNIATLIHPDAIVSEGATIEEGVVVMPGAVINTDSIIKRGSIINTSCSVDHDCYIGEYSHIAPGAHLCGNVKINHSCWIGAGATICNNVSLCEKVFIGAGSLVLQDIIESGTYVGIPVRKIK